MIPYLTLFGIFTASIKGQRSTITKNEVNLILMEIFKMYLLKLEHKIELLSKKAEKGNISAEEKRELAELHIERRTFDIPDYIGKHQSSNEED